MYQKDDVIQFTENHKWCGSLGIIDEVKKIGDDVKYLIGVPIPEQGIAYIFSMESANEFEFVGKALLTMKGDDSDEI